MEEVMYGLSKLEWVAVRNFAALGMEHVAYVKPVRVKGVATYAIHAADGTYLCRYADRDAAMAAVRQHELSPVSLH
jgi:hypothetical protein